MDEDLDAHLDESAGTLSEVVAAVELLLDLGVVAGRDEVVH